MKLCVLLTLCIFTVYGDDKDAMKKAKEKLADPCPKSIKLPMIDKDENLNQLKTKKFDSKAGFEMTMQIEFDYDALPRQKDDPEVQQWVFFNFFEPKDDGSNHPIFASDEFRFRIVTKDSGYELQYESTSRFNSKKWDKVKKGDKFKINIIARQDEAYISINGFYVNLFKTYFLRKNENLDMTHKRLYLLAFVNKEASKVKSIDAKIKVYQKASKDKSDTINKANNKAKKSSGRYKKVRKELDGINSVGANQAGIWIWMAIIAAFFIQFGIFFFM